MSLLQGDDNTVEGKIFPRASAYGERLWSNPTTKWYAAEHRMLQHRLRLTQRGVRADRLQPEWCRQNGGQCYVAEDNPHAPPPPEPTTTEGSTTAEVRFKFFNCSQYSLGLRGNVFNFF